MRNQKTRLLAIVGAAAVVLAIAGAALAADPSASPSGAPEASASSEATSTPAPTSSPASPAAQSTPAPTPKAAATPVAPKTTETPEAAETPDTEPAPATLKGVLTTGTDADGDPAYFIGTTRIGVGPPWFWGDKNPLAPYVGKTVTLTGHMDQGKPASTNPNGKAKAAEGPEFEVYTVNGTTVRAPGKPPWAGGPKVVGEKHPGYKGWSQGQAGKDKAPKP